MQPIIQLLPVLLLTLWLLNGCALVGPTVQTLQVLTSTQAQGNSSTTTLTDTTHPPLDDTTVAMDSTLLHMLDYVPNEPAYREYLTFGDVTAWYSATGMTPVTSLDGWQQLEQPQRDRWAFDLSLQTLPPDALGVRYVTVEDMREFYGFSFFDAERFLETGRPPDNFTVLKTSVEPTEIEVALHAFGYTISSLENGTLYSIRGDNEIYMESPTKIGQLGQLNRIALLDDTLVIGRATELVKKVARLANGAGATLADDPMYRALAVALATPEVIAFGELVGAILIGQPLPTDPLVLLDQDNEAIQAQFERYAQAPLPPYLALGFATERAGDTSYLTLAVVFPPGIDGNAAAEILGERLVTYHSVVTGDTLADRWTFVQAIGVESDGLPVALVTMQSSNASAGDEAYKRPITWSEMVFQRDLLFLLVGEPVRP